MRVFDCFPFNDELDILEMRFTEVADAVDVVIAVEADVDHQDHPKPYHLTENLDRFEQWWDKLHVVRASGLPSVDEFPDPWAREQAQREWIAQGLEFVMASPSDVVLQSDVDEIPTALHARNVRPRFGELVPFGQRGHFWAVDWLYPLPWFGTVAGTVATVSRLGEMPFSVMRDQRNLRPASVHRWNTQDAGWHFSWLGGVDRVRKKVGSFCHPEVLDQIEEGIADDLRFWREGVHVDGLKMEPVDVDSSWPKWIVDGNAPDSWYRPRGI